MGDKRVKRKKRMTRREIDSGLDDVVKTLRSDMIKALDIKQASRKLEETIRRLKEREEALNETINHLTKTRDMLYKELEMKKNKERELKSKVMDLKDDKTSLESDKMLLAGQVNNLRKEKEHLELSLEKTNDMLVELKSHIEGFDEEIRK